MPAGRKSVRGRRVPRGKRLWRLGQAGRRRGWSPHAADRAGCPRAARSRSTRRRTRGATCRRRTLRSSLACARPPLLAPAARRRAAAQSSATWPSHVARRAGRDLNSPTSRSTRLISMSSLLRRARRARHAVGCARATRRCCSWRVALRSAAASSMRRRSRGMTNVGSTRRVPLRRPLPPDFRPQALRRATHLGDARARKLRALH